MFYKMPKRDYERPPFNRLLMVIAILLLSYVLYNHRADFTPEKQQVLDTFGIKIVPVPSDKNTTSEHDLNKKTDNPDSHNTSP